MDEGIRLAEQAATEASELEGPEIANAVRGDVAMLLLTAGRREESRALMTDVIAEARANDFSMSGTTSAGSASSTCSRPTTSPHAVFSRTPLVKLEASATRGKHGRCSGSAMHTSVWATADPPERPSVSSSRSLQTPARRSDLTSPLRWADSRDRSNRWTSAKAPGWRERSHNCATTAGGLKTWMWPQEREIEVRFEQPLIDALGEGEYRSAHEEGRTLSFDETLSLARSLAAS